MEQDRLKVPFFMLKFVLLLQLTNSINQQFGVEASQSEMFERMSKIEVHNQEQQKEISILKNQRKEDRNEIHHLRERVSQLEASTPTNNMTNEDSMLRRQKRPVRLLPTSILR